MRFFTYRRVLVSSILFILLALVNFPYHFYYMLSDDKVFSEATVMEIHWFRIALILIGILGVVGILTWKLRLEATISSDFRSFLQEGHDLRNGRKLVWGWTLLTSLIFLGLLQTMQWSHLYEYDETATWYHAIARENGVWESLTAISLFASSMIFLTSLIKQKNTYLTWCSMFGALSLGALFFLGAGEEISWGQSIFNFETSEEWSSINVQKEFNIHNLYGYWANRLMMIFFFVYLAFLPVTGRLFADMHYLVQRLGIPVGPLAFVPWTLIALLMGDNHRQRAIWGNPEWRLSEASEVIFGILVLGTTIAYYQKRKGKASEVSSNCI